MIKKQMKDTVLGTERACFCALNLSTFTHRILKPEYGR